MLQKGVTHVHVVLIFGSELIPMNDKEALFLPGSQKIFLGHDFKDIVTHLESNWLQLVYNVLACFVNVAECQVVWTLNIWEILLPFL
jgi:hypothetical protein